MAFAITLQQPIPQDVGLRARAGIPVLPEDDETSAPLMASPAPAAAPASGGSPAPYRPSLWDIAQGVIFNGQSFADSAMSARQRDYQARTMAIMGDVLRSAPKDQQLAMLLNPAELGKAVASRFQSMAMKGGETRNNGEGGGPSFTAPLLGFDPISGKGTSVGPGGVLSTGGVQLPGEQKADAGLIVDTRRGPTGQTYTLPQIVPFGSRGVMAAPSLSGSGATAPAAQPGPVTTSTAKSPLTSANGQLDPAAFFHSFVLPHEGGLNPRDLNGSPTKYGINQAANPGVDVSKLTPEGASTIFADKYFGPSGAGHLPPALAAVHADTSFINPKKAAQILVQSGGDPGKYMDQREAWLNGIVEKYPAAQKYAQAWTTRNADLRKVAGQLGGGGGEQVRAAGGNGSVFAEGRGPEIVPGADPVYSRFPPGTVLQRSPNGELSVVQKPEYSPKAKTAIRDHAMGDEYKLSQASSAAYKAMLGNAATMTGPSAYAMLDTFARAINPGAVARQSVIDTIEKHLGLPAQLVGGLESKFGQGNLPPNVRQQIINAVVPFAQSHWDQANTMMQANAALAKSHGFDAADVTAPIGSRPQGVSVTVPPPQARHQGLYVTPRGVMQWTGSGWQAQN